MKKLLVATCAGLLVLGIGCGGGGGSGTTSPDLSITSVTFAPASLEVGADLTVSSIAKNEGNADAPATNITFYLSSNTVIDALDTLLGTRPVPALAAGVEEAAAVDAVLAVPDSVAAGNYYVIGRIDAANAIAESNETNNDRASATLVAVTRTPNLTVDNVTLGATAVAVNEQVVVNRRLRNTGKGDAGAFRVTYYLSEDEDIDVGDFVAGYHDIASLAAETDSSGSYSISSGGTVGTFYVLVRIDSEDAVTESDETDNDAQATEQLEVVATGYPDLVGAITSAPAIMYVGQTVEVSVRITNQGLASKPDGVTFSNTLYISDDDVADGGDTVFGQYNINAGLAVGQQINYTFTLPVPNHTGTDIYLLWVVDENDDIDEGATGGEDNNQSEQTVDVSPPPDLRANGTFVTDQPFALRIVRAGGLMRPGVGVQELTGIDVLDDFVLSTFLSEDETINPAVDTEIGTRIFNGLLGGTSGGYWFDCTVPADMAPGFYYIGSFVDSDDDVFEANEANNIDTAPLWDVEVLPKALTLDEYDIVASDIWLSEIWVDSGGGYWEPQLVRGTHFQAGAEVLSCGGDPDVTFRVGVYMSDDPIIDLSDTLVGYVDTTHTEITGLMGGDITIICQVPLGFTPGDYYYGLIVDTLDAVDEVYEDNNVTNDGYGQWVVVVDPADASIDIEADGLEGPPVIIMEATRPFSVAPRIRVSGNCETGPFTVNFYLSTDETITTGDTLVGTWIIPAPGLPAGYREEDMTATWKTITAPTAGTFYFGFIVDVNDDVAESKEFNNVYLQDGPQVTVLPNGMGAPDLVCLLYMPADGPPQPPTFYAQLDDAAVDLPMMIVGNFGTRDVPAGTLVNIYLATDTTEPPTPAGDYLVGAYICDALPAGQYHFVEWPTTLDFTGIDPGTYYMYAFIDPDNEIAELDENNNDSATWDMFGERLGAWIPVVISGDYKPNLIAHEVDTNDVYWYDGVNPPWVWTGAGVMNTSMSVDAGPSVVALWISTNDDLSIDGGDVYVGSTVVGHLSKAAGNSWVQINTQLPFLPTAGLDYYFKAVVDVLGEVNEMNETDNIGVSEACRFAVW